MRRTPPFDTYLQSNLYCLCAYVLSLLISGINSTLPIHLTRFLLYTRIRSSSPFPSEPTFETPIQSLENKPEPSYLKLKNMPLPSLHPSLPQNPTTNMASSSSSYFSSGAGRAVGSTVGGSGGGSGGVNRETLKGLQDVVWSDDEVGHVSSRLTRLS